MWRDYFRFNADALKLRFFEAEHPFWVIIEDCDSENILHSETFILKQN